MAGQIKCYTKDPKDLTEDEVCELLKHEVKLSGEYLKKYCKEIQTRNLDGDVLQKMSIDTLSALLNLSDGHRIKFENFLTRFQPKQDTQPLETHAERNDVVNKPQNIGTSVVANNSKNTGSGGHYIAGKIDTITNTSNDRLIDKFTKKNITRNKRKVVGVEIKSENSQVKCRNVKVNDRSKKHKK